MQGGQHRARCLKHEEDDFERLVLFFVEHLAVDAEQYTEQREELDREVDVVAPVVALEDVVDETICRAENHDADA